jgi:nitroimidazol reductase NimA-like FMN-containing flavoprotein (pyridoxamine 5'-phosphate oxidase superfamily)
MGETAFEILSEDECLRLLTGAQYGRVAVVVNRDRPEIFPINFILHQRTVAFLTSSPVLLSWAPLGKVAFEADWVDPDSHEGWDVVVTGVGADITDSVDNLSQLVRTGSFEIWAPGPKDRWIAIVEPYFSGRRLYRPTPSPAFG